jgi:hypothetical protein
VTVPINNPEHVRILKEGVDVWNAWRKIEKLRVAKEHLSESAYNDERYLNAWLMDTNLCVPELKAVNFSAMNLSKADFIGARLWTAKFEGADLREANFWGADLTAANFGGADLRGANLEEADLTRAVLRGPGLTVPSWTELGSTALTSAPWEVWMPSTTEALYRQYWYYPPF